MTSKIELEAAIKILRAERSRHSKIIDNIDTQIVGLNEEILKLKEAELQEKAMFNNRDDDYY